MQRKGYSFVNHTADVELVARGKSLNEAFKNAVLALFDTSADISKVKKSKGKIKVIKIKEKSDKLEDLLWSTLQDALSNADSMGVYGYAVKKMRISHADEYKLYCESEAKEQDPKLSVIYVKGVSRYDLKVTKEKSGFKATAVLDV